MVQAAEVFEVFSLMWTWKRALNKMMQLFLQRLWWLLMCWTMCFKGARTWWTWGGWRCCRWSSFSNVKRMLHRWAVLNVFWSLRQFFCVGRLANSVSNSFKIKLFLFCLFVYLIHKCLFFQHLWAIHVPVNVQQYQTPTVLLRTLCSMVHAFHFGRKEVGRRKHI